MGLSLTSMSKRAGIDYLHYPELKVAESGYAAGGTRFSTNTGYGKNVEDLWEIDQGRILLPACQEHPNMQVNHNISSESNA